MIFKDSQLVCLACGFNMIIDQPETCPFCGAPSSKFMPMEQITKNFHVEEININDKVTQLRSTPALGYEHAAYRLKTKNEDIWIDCPSSFDNKIKPAKKILFTHHHFLGSSNLYRELKGTEVAINENDSSHEICKRFTFDHLFKNDFTLERIEAFHINGHTPGFTFYIFEKTLFVCDYILLTGNNLHYIPFGPPDKIKSGGKRIMKIISNRDIEDVCAYNYTLKFKKWFPLFKELVNI